MSVPTETREVVRIRANLACEYCGVTEIDAASELTIDHYQPRSQGGLDDLSNLVYCCYRCNLNKADYWPKNATDERLWNPRQDDVGRHFFCLADGTMHAITSTGAFTLARLNLNRPSLVANRQRRMHLLKEDHILEEIRAMRIVMKQMQLQQDQIVKEYDNLLRSQRVLLDWLWQKLS